MSRKRPMPSSDKVELLMTPMIDIVFQLLIFFIMSFKIAAQEGDFQIRMPRDDATPAPTTPQERLPLRVHLHAHDDGSLAKIIVNDQLDFGTDFSKLRLLLVQMRGMPQCPGNPQIPTDADLHCDTNLHYEFVIKALTTVHGFIQDGRTVKLIERINLATDTATVNK